MSIAAGCQDFFPISEGNEIYNNEYVIGEFTFKWFEKVVGVAILEVNNHTVCDTCSQNRGRVGSLPRNSCYKESIQFRRCMTSPKGNKQTETHCPRMRKKLGHRIRPNHMLPETPLEKKTKK